MRVLSILIIALLCIGELSANPNVTDIINNLLKNPINKTSVSQKVRTTQINEIGNTDETGINQSGSNFSEVLLKTGIQFYNNHLYQQSIDKLNELITTFPQSPYKDNAHVWIGKGLIRQYKYKQAINEFKNVKSDSGEFPTAIFFSGQAQQYTGNYLQAIESFNRIQSQFTTHELADNALLHVGKICLSNKMGLLALETTLKLIKNYATRETIDEAYYLLGKIFEQDPTMKDIEIARTIYKKFLQNVKNGKKHFKHSPLKYRVKRDLTYLEEHYFN